VFGPLPTRRLGWSLGIDTVPAKTCNWNCVYCQLGRTHPLTNTRRDFVSHATIIEEVRRRLAERGPKALDWITFVASGEGMLHRGLGDLIRTVKRVGDRPVAVITNGSLLARADVRAELAAADAVLPTLDAGNAELFRRINRPHRALTFEQHVAGLQAFANMPRRGRIWIEVMLVAGLNDSDAALQKLATVLHEIAPDEVHLTLPTRCPVEEWVRPPPPEGVRRAEALLGAVGKLDVSSRADDVFGKQASTPDELVSIVTRHPLSRADLRRVLPQWPDERIEVLVTSLRAEGRIQLVRRGGETFVAAACLRYPAAARRKPVVAERNFPETPS
jgi:wyosine [tRNA(Phe)-imidazoG37] synthetase (radical SAM superfamily)